MIDVYLPTTDGRELLLTRYTQRDLELRLLIHQLKLQFATQPLPRIATGSGPASRCTSRHRDARPAHVRENHFRVVPALVPWRGIVLLAVP